MIKLSKLKHFTWAAASLLAFMACDTANSQENEPQNAYFRSILISQDFKFEDSYILEAADFNNDGYPDILTYGLGAYITENEPIPYPMKSPIHLFTNPGVTLDDASQTWKHTTIAELETPVALNKADIDGDGWVDVLMSNDYGKSILEPLNGGGVVFWLRNPGRSGGEWEKRLIGNDTGMHRIVTGHFTQNERLEVVTLPVIGRQNNIHSAIPVSLYEKPSNPLHQRPWLKKPIMDSYFHLIHDAWVGKNTALSDLDVMLVGSQEGINWLYYDRSGKWNIEHVSDGETSLTDYIDPKTNRPITEMWFTGTNTASPGKVNGKEHQFIAAIEPFHGGNLTTYVRSGQGWTRNVIEKYGKVDKQGLSVGHYVITEDFDQDGTDEFMAVFPREPKGLLYGRVKDLKKNSFEVTRIFDQSAARTAVADFDKNGTLDVATVGYKVRFYYEDDNPQMFVHLNRMEKKK